MKPRLSLLALTLLACGGQAPPPSSPPAVSSTPPVAATPPAPAPVDAEPTVLTARQKERDLALAAKVAVVSDAFFNRSAVYSPDGKWLLFRSNRDGLPEGYVGEVAKPAAPPKKVAGGTERVDGLTFSRDGKFILYRSDHGADENYRIYRAATDGSSSVCLTPGEVLHRGNVVLPRKRPDTMIYSASATVSPETRIVVQSIAGGDPKVVFFDPSPGGVTDASADGSHALFLREVSLSEVILFEIDMKARSERRVYPPEGKRALLSSAAYSSDEKRILVTTDDGGERSSLVALDAASLAEKARYVQADPSTASLDDFAVSPRGDAIALTVDAGNRTEVRILDARSLKMKALVKAPLGTNVSGAFEDDGKRFTMTESLPDKPADVYAVDASTGEVSALRKDPRPGIDQLPPMTVSSESIKAFDGLTIPANLYLPARPDKAAKLPTIVQFHGGPAGSSRLGWNAWNRVFTSQGFAVIDPNIRGSTGFGRAYEMGDNKEKRGDAMKDVASVNAWARSQPWCDGQRMIIFGGSYGGYLVLMGLTRQSGIWSAGVDLVGPSDLKAFLRSTDQAIRSVFVDEFGDLDKDAALLEEWSPMRDKDKIAAPLFVYQGANDPRVPKPESDAIVKSLRERRVPVEYMLAMNEGHSVDRRETRIEFLTRTMRFLQDELKIGK